MFLEMNVDWLIIYCFDVFNMLYVMLGNFGLNFVKKIILLYEKYSF